MAHKLGIRLCLHVLLLLSQVPVYGLLHRGRNSENHARSRKIFDGFEAMEKTAFANRPPAPNESFDRQLTLLEMLERLSSQRGFDGETAVKSKRRQPFSFTPAALNFGPTPLCTPTVVDVAIQNNALMSVELYALTSHDWRFLVAGFEPGMLPTGQTFKVPIVFLPSGTGDFRCHLTLFTSLGQFEVHAQGIGVENPLGLRPMSGAFLPFGEPFEHTLELHNPSPDKDLEIKDLFATEPNIELDFNWELEAVGWVVKPKDTAAVVTVRMTYVRGSPRFALGKHS